MCIAIVIPKGATVNKDYLHNGWCGNSDGGGFAYVRKGKVKIVKSLMKWKTWEDAYYTAREANPDSPFLVHFRIRSAGSNTADNTHPYALKTGAVIHNGTLTGSGADWYRGPSDTAKFVEKFGEHLTYDNVLSKKLAMEAAIGYNKLAFLFNNGKFVIVNEDAGLWDAGVWYSNGSFRTNTAVGTYGGHTRCDY